MVQIDPELSKRYKDFDCIQAHLDVARDILEDLQRQTEKNPKLSKEFRINFYEERIKKIVAKMSKYEMDTIGKDIAVDPTSMCSKVHVWVQISDIPAVTGEEADSQIEEGDANSKAEATGKPAPSLKVEIKPNAEVKPENENGQHAAAAPEGEEVGSPIEEAKGKPAPSLKVEVKPAPRPNAEVKPGNGNEEHTDVAPETEGTKNIAEGGGQSPE